MANASYQPIAELPLAQRAEQIGPHWLGEAPFVSKIQLRGLPKNPAFLQSVSKTLGVDLPLEANTVASKGDYTVFWLGPDEWEIHAPEAEQQSLTQALAEALSEQHAAVVDVSDYYTVIRLQGPEIWTIFAKGSPLDTHPERQPRGSCAQTRYAKSSVLLYLVAEDCLELRVRRSLASYVYQYLAQGALEYVPAAAE